LKNLSAWNAYSGQSALARIPAAVDVLRLACIVWALMPWKNDSSWPVWFS
jgi:hypothetical protein